MTAKDPSSGVGPPARPIRNPGCSFCTPVKSTRALAPTHERLVGSQALAWTGPPASGHATLGPRFQGDLLHGLPALAGGDQTAHALRRGHDERPGSIPGIGEDLDEATTIRHAGRYRGFLVFRGEQFQDGMTWPNKTASLSMIKRGRCSLILTISNATYEKCIQIFNCALTDR